MNMEEEIQELQDDDRVETVEPSEPSELTDPTPEPEPAPEEDLYVHLDDTTRITREEAAQLGQIYRHLQTDPRTFVANLAQQYLNDYDFVPRQQQQQYRAPEPVLDDETIFDPQKLQGYINYRVQQGIGQAVGPIQDELVQRRMTEANSYATHATQQFAGRYGLSGEQADAIAEEAARLGILNSIAPSKDPISAVNEALEIAAWRQPAFRDHVSRLQAEQEKESQKRQRKLSMVSGSSGSIPRNTTNRPRGENEVVRAIASDIAAHTGYENWDRD